jgi:hypothetical protein
MPMYSKSVAHWEEPLLADKYGPLLSTAGHLPAIVLGLLPFHDTEQFRRDALNLRRSSFALVYSRDDGPGGRVTLNRQVRVHGNIIADESPWMTRVPKPRGQ